MKANHAIINNADKQSSEGDSSDALEEHAGNPGLFAEPNRKRKLDDNSAENGPKIKKQRTGSHKYGPMGYARLIQATVKILGDDKEYFAVIDVTKEGARA